MWYIFMSNRTLLLFYFWPRFYIGVLGIAFFSGRIYFFHILFWLLFLFSIYIWTFISLLFPFFFGLLFNRSHILDFFNFFFKFTWQSVGLHRFISWELLACARSCLCKTGGRKIFFFSNFRWFDTGLFQWHGSPLDTV